MFSQLREKMRQAGIVGAGGAGFPSYAKLTEDIDTLIINGAECEPLLYTDYIIMREQMPKICQGIKEIADAIGVKNAFLSIKEHTAKRLSLSDGEKLSKDVTVRVLPDVYPMGDEIVLIYQTIGKVVAPGKLPASIGVIVYNLETVLNTYNVVFENRGVTEKTLTVGGDVEKPYVIRVPLGARVSDIFSSLGIKVDEDHSVLDGGPSMGAIINPNTAIVKKTTKGLLVLPNTSEAIKSKQVSMDVQLKRASSACCQCTRCTDMCPRALLGYPLEPHRLVRVATSSEVIDPSLFTSASICSSCGICTVAACSQGISPKDVILKLKSELAKNKLRFSENVNPVPSPQRDYRIIPSERWKTLLDVSAFDKETELYTKNIEINRVEIPMQSHIGAPSVPKVKVGDKVLRGDMIADAFDGLSVPQYASIDGRVTFVDNTKILIEK